MGEWRECKLGEVVEYIARGISPKYSESDGTIVINQKCIRDGKINYEFTKVNDFSKKISDEKFLKQYDTLVNSTGVGTLGRVGLYDLENDACTADSHVMIARASKDVDKKWFFYNLFARQDEIELLGEGSTGQTELARLRLAELDIYLPPLKEQKAIAEVLSSLDDKIDLLHRQNKTLEELAQTLFRQWFIEGEETTSYLFEELVDSISIKHNFNNDKVIFLNTSDVYDGKVLHNNYSSVSGLPGQAKKSIQKGDILFTEIRPANKRFAFIDFEADDYVVSTKLMVLRSKNVLDTSIVYLFLKQQDTLNYLQMLAESRSGTFPQITFDHLKTVEIFVPKDKDILESTTNIFKDIVTKTFRNHASIKTLKNLRDTLLPKLMSGEVRVKLRVK